MSSSMNRPKDITNTLKKLRFFLGSVHFFSKLIPNLAQFCHPLKLLLRKPTKYTCIDVHTVHFNAIKTRIANHTENTHYNPQHETRTKCDAFVPFSGQL